MPGIGFDLISEMNYIHNKMLLNCAFGNDVALQSVPYTKQGVTGQKPLFEVIGQLYAQGLKKLQRKEQLIVPYLQYFNYTTEDKEFAKNCKSIRNHLVQQVRNRKVSLRKTDFSEIAHPDLMTIFLYENDFKTKEKQIIDECLTFIVAAMRPTTVASANML